MRSVEARQDAYQSPKFQCNLCFLTNVAVFTFVPTMVVKGVHAAMQERRALPPLGLANHAASVAVRSGAAMGVRMVAYEWAKRQDPRSELTGAWRAFLSAGAAELAVRALFFPARPVTGLIPGPWFALVPTAAVRMALYDTWSRKTIEAHVMRSRRPDGHQSASDHVSVMQWAATRGFMVGSVSQTVALVASYPVMYAHSWATHYGPLARNHTASNMTLTARLMTRAPWPQVNWASVVVWGVVMGTYELWRVVSGMPTSGEAAFIESCVAWPHEASTMRG